MPLGHEGRSETKATQHTHTHNKRRRLLFKESTFCLAALTSSSDLSREHGRYQHCNEEGQDDGSSKVPQLSEEPCRERQWLHACASCILLHSVYIKYTTNQRASYNTIYITYTSTHTKTHSLPLFSLILTSKGILISLPPTALPLRTGGKEATPTHLHTAMYSAALIVTAMLPNGLE